MKFLPRHPERAKRLKDLGPQPEILRYAQDDKQ